MGLGIVGGLDLFAVRIVVRISVDLGSVAF